MIGKKLTELRKRRGMTQKQVAKVLKIPRSTYSNYELDNREPDFETVKILAGLFNTNTDEILGMVNNEDETQLDKDRKYALGLFEKITDPEKKKAAIEVLKGLAGEK